ncbi:MAG: hypothetical protein Q9209_001230 [Squamulea sp. 1 TL-2023]
MSIDIDWHGLTTGPEGLVLAESIRDFIHVKFQQVQLPRFIRSVEIHSFEFGDEAPVVELKDIGDPLGEFYDAEDENESQADEGLEEKDTEYQSSTKDLKDHGGRPPPKTHNPKPERITQPPLSIRHLPIDTRFRPDVSRSSTPGIPGGTSNLSYFHLPLSAGLSGTSTPLAAVASGNAAAWSDTHIPSLHAHPPFAHIRQHSPVRQPQSPQRYADPSSRPSTSDSLAPEQSHEMIDNPSESLDSRQGKRAEPSPTDLQIVLHISYTGTVKLSMTAEILLDYPMPSFVGIPLKLNITGLSFDGVAFVAYLRKRAHFCFLGPEDARMLVGEGDGGEEKGSGLKGGLLREIRVESEIGRQEGGKQVLRNVGKVEKFVLEQVRRIFEEEVVWPSFWTVLV